MLLIFTLLLWLPNAYANIEQFNRGEQAIRYQDYEKAFRIFKPFAEKGNAQAQEYLSDMYFHGAGVPKSIKKSLIWRRKAVEQGSATATAFFGVMRFLGGEIPQDDIYSYMWFYLVNLNEIEEYQAEAMDEAVSALRTRMLSKDIVKAKELAKECLESNYENCGAVWQSAIDDTEEVLERGLNAISSNDYKKAYGIFRPLAENNNSEAQYVLGKMYYDGLHVSMNYKRALNWFRKSATSGHAEALKIIGKMYEQGEGIKQNYINAYMWQHLAKLNLADEAIQNLKSLEKTMLPDDIKMAKKLASACWESNYKNCWKKPWWKLW